MRSKFDHYPMGYQTVRALLGRFARVYNRLEVEGTYHIPPVGSGALLCASHEGYPDPFFIAVAASDRYMRPIMEKIAYDFPGIHSFVKRMGAIPVPVVSGNSLSREGTDRAINAMSTFMKTGDLGLIFPEGMIKFWRGSDDLRRFKLGAVRAAALAGVPIIPTAIYGSRFSFANLLQLKMFQRFHRRFVFPVFLLMLLPAKVMIRFGAPIEVDPKAATDREVAIRETVRLQGLVEEMRKELKGRYLRSFFSSAKNWDLEN